jgi:hypothetical protein
MRGLRLWFLRILAGFLGIGAMGLGVVGMVDGEWLYLLGAVTLLAFALAVAEINGRTAEWWE